MRWPAIYKYSGEIKLKAWGIASGKRVRLPCLPYRQAKDRKKMKKQNKKTAN
jgi:hypothetical protein